MTLKAILDSVDGLPPELAAEYQEKDGKFHLITPEGFKPLTEFNVVHTALGKERNDHKVTRQKLSAFGDLDPEDVRVKLERLPELEAAAEGKLDETKIATIVESRVKQKIAPIERERDSLKLKVGEQEKTILELNGNEQKRSLQELVRAAASKAGVQPVALEDALMLAERAFERDESGNFVVKNGVNGFTPGIGPDVWLTQVKESRPHWWGESGGGGARGSGSGSKGGANPWSAENWSLTEQGKIYSADPAKAEQMAKAAGTKIGGTRPAKK